MTLPDADTDIANHGAPPPERPPLPEPPWMERVRRIGWGLMLLSFAAMVAARMGPQALYVAAVVAAFVSGSLGLLGVVNVALVRGLYKRIEMKLADTSDSEQ